VSLIRDLHDDLFEELSTLSFKIDSQIGDEELESKVRFELRTLQRHLANLLDLLREEVSGAPDPKAPIFSIAIRELISVIQNQVKALPSNESLSSLRTSLESILSFPTTILEEKQRRSAKSYDLTKRELEVLRLLPSAATFKAMATSLFLTEATVKTHCASLYRKLEVNNRTGAIAVALEVGLLKRQ